MRRKLCYGLLLACSIIVGSLLSVCSDVSSIEYSDAYYRSVSGATLYYNNGGSLNFVTSGGGAYWAGSGIQNTSGVNYLSVGLSNSLNGPAIVTLIIKTQAPLGTYPQIAWGAKSYRYTVVDQEFGEYGTAFITLYLESDVSGSIDLTPTGFGNFTSADIQVSPVYTVVLDKVPTRSQITAISSTLTGMYADLDVMNARITDINTHVTSILSQIGDLVNNSDRTADAVEEQNEKDEQDRSNIESQSSDTDSAAESSSEDAESTGTTLLGAFSAFVTALTNASPSNCVIDMDMGNLDLGNVDFCTLSPPQPIPTIASIFLILFCVPLSIATAKKVINLFRSFQ